MSSFSGRSNCLITYVNIIHCIHLNRIKSFASYNALISHKIVIVTVKLNMLDPDYVSLRKIFVGSPPFYVSCVISE